MKSTRADITTSVVVALILLFYIISLFFPAYWNWSVFQIFTDILTDLIILLAIMLVLLALFSGKFKIPIFPAKTARVYRLPRIITAILWIAVPGVILYLLRTNCFIYGDGLLILSHIAQDQTISSSAYGTSLLIKLLANLFNLNEWSQPALLMSGISIICGITFVYFTYKIYSLIIPSKTDRLLLYLITLTSGTIILFTGYIETYPLLTCWLTIYIYAAIKSNRNQLSIYVVVAIYLTGLFWHIWFLAFLPSLLYLINSRFMIIKAKLLIIISILFVPSLYIAGQILARTDLPLTINLLPTENSPDYYLFSIKHLADFVNELIICGPVLIISGIVLLFFIPRNKYNFNLSFLIYTAIPALCASFYINPVLGAARDWDMLSLFAVPLIILSALLYSHFSKHNRKLSVLLIPILMITLYHSSGFITTNKNDSQAVKRISQILLNDPHYQSNYYDGIRNISYATILSNVYMMHDLSTQFLLRKSSDEITNAEDNLRLAKQYYNSNDFENAQKYYTLAKVDILFDNHSRFCYGKALHLTGHDNLAISELTSLSQDTSVADIYYYLGNSYLSINNFELASDNYDLAIEAAQSNINLIMTIAPKFYNAGQYEYSLAYYQRANQIDPNFQGLLYYLANNYTITAEYDSALKYINLLISTDSISEQSYIVRYQYYNCHPVNNHTTIVSAAGQPESDQAYHKHEPV